MFPQRENNSPVSASAASVLQLPERLPAASEQTGSLSTPQGATRDPFLRLPENTG